MPSLFRPAGLAAGLLSLALLAPAVDAQIVVTTGDDLQAAVDAAPSGSVIEIFSDATFTGQVVFNSSSDKDLTLRAAPGYTPTIDGQGLTALLVYAGDAELRFEGLQLKDSSSSAGSAVVTGSLSSSEELRVSFEDCTFADRLSVFSSSGTGMGFIELRACTILNEYVNTSLLSPGVAYELLLEDCDVPALWLSAGYSPSFAVTVRDTLVRDYAIVDYGDGVTEMTMQRCEVRGPVSLEAYTLGSSPTTARLRLESCLVRGLGGTDDGVTLDDQSGATNLQLELVNSTVTGWDKGVSLPLTAQAPGAIVLRNSVLVDNAFDLTGSLVGVDAQRNRAEDLDLGPGNGQGATQLDADFAIVSGTPGVDAGLAAGAGLGATDLHGNPRIVDVDCDGVAEVSIGAVEVPPSLLATKSTFSGGNPAGTTTGKAVVGATLPVQIDLGPAGILAFAAIGAPAAAPFPIPGWKGHVLIDPAGFSLYATPTGNLSLPVPLDLSLVGLPISLQGVRAELGGGAAVLVQLLDRVDLVIGY